MKFFLALLAIFTLVSSFQCNKCRSRDLRLNGSRSWFPLKGRTQLSFKDRVGQTETFSLRVIDTTEMSTDPECGAITRFEYINTTLYLNPTRTDSINFLLGHSGSLCAQAVSTAGQHMSTCGVFGQAKEGRIARKFSYHVIGAKTYPEVILLLRNEGTPDNIDSIYIADGIGIAGFRYNNRVFTLE